LIFQDLLVSRNADVNPTFVFPDMEHKYLESITRFIYAGELKVKKEDLAGVMIAAVKLRITIHKIVTINESADSPRDADGPLSSTHEDAESSQEVKVLNTTKEQKYSVMSGSISTRPKRKPSLNSPGRSPKELKKSIDGPSRSKGSISESSTNGDLLEQSSSEKKVLMISKPAAVSTRPKRKTNNRKESEIQPKPIDFQLQNDTNFLNMFTSPGEYFCGYCRKPNKNKKCKQSHERTCSLNPSKPVFPCPQCPTTYSRHYRLAAHIKTHL